MENVLIVNKREDPNDQESTVRPAGSKIGQRERCRQVFARRAVVGPARARYDRLVWDSIWTNDFRHLRCISRWIRTRCAPYWKGCRIPDAKGVRPFAAATEDRKGGCAGGQATAITAGDCQRASALYLGGDYMNSSSRRASLLTFEPIFMERIWGGRKLADLFGKNLPANKRIGESWEIVDRPEAQSVVSNGPLKGKALHELWSQHRQEIFGTLPEAPRFPLLIKLLDAQEKLSLQVHPSEKIAAKLGGESKTECWYVAAADAGAELFVGFKKSITRQQFEKSLRAGSAADEVHTVKVRAGDAMVLPAGRFHAVGAGNLLVEIQQN